MHVLLLDVVGKQSYIFGTNKLREAVGASELVAEVTTTWLDEAVEASAREQPDVAVGPVVQVSGRALYTVTAPDREREAAVCRALVRAVTTRALRPVERVEEDVAACGLQVLGVWHALPDGQDGVRPEDVKALESDLERLRVRGEQPLARLPRLPVVAACVTSDQPAARLLDDGSGDGAQALSAVSTAKRGANWRGRSRVRDQLRSRLGDQGELVAAGDLEVVLQGEVQWLGVVHADGNRIGDLIHGLGPAGGSYQDRYREFSAALDECTMASLADAVAQLRRVRDDTQPGRAGATLPLVPLIASGDDLTALVDGRYALPFAAAYLRAFEHHSASGVLAQTAAEAGVGGHLTAAAGVSVVKPHFPFSVAYQLCEQACESAKVLSRRAGVSAIDWHVHYDSIGRELSQVRRQSRPSEGYSLVRRPYAVVGADRPLPAAARGRDWRDLERIVAQVPVRPHPEPGEALPMSQLHRLRRELVDRGPAAAERLYRGLLGRPELGALLGRLGETLFAEVPVLAADGGDGAQEHSTLLLDFLDGAFIRPAGKLEPVTDGARV